MTPDWQRLVWILVGVARDVVTEQMRARGEPDSAIDALLTIADLNGELTPIVADMAPGVVAWLTIAADRTVRSTFRRAVHDMLAAQATP